MLRSLWSNSSANIFQTAPDRKRLHIDDVLRLTMNISSNKPLAASPFTIIEPQNPWIDEFYVVQERCATDFRSSKIVKGFVRCKTQWQEFVFPDSWIHLYASFDNSSDFLLLVYTSDRTFHFSEPQNPRIDGFYVVKNIDQRILKALEWSNVRSCLI